MSLRTLIGISICIIGAFVLGMLMPRYQDVSVKTESVIEGDFVSIGEPPLFVECAGNIRRMDIGRISGKLVRANLSGIVIRTELRGDVWIAPIYLQENCFVYKSNLI